MRMTKEEKIEIVRACVLEYFLQHGDWCSIKQLAEEPLCVLSEAQIRSVIWDIEELSNVEGVVESQSYYGFPVYRKVREFAPSRKYLRTKILNLREEVCRV